MKLARFAPIAAAMTLLASVALLAIAQTGSDHEFKGGYLTHKIEIPDGCTKICYEVIDWDPISNDTLLSKKCVTPDGDSHIMNMKWNCIDGDVVGPNGSSGEGECSAFVRVTYTIGSGSSATSYTKDSGYYTLSCE